MKNINLTLSSSDSGMLDKTVCDIIDAVKTDVSIVGPVPLPVKTGKFKDLKMATVIHKRVMVLENVTENVIKALTDMQIPIGVKVEIA